jgi:hypothetical protein
MITPAACKKYGISPIRVNSILNKQSAHSTPITVGMVKLKRLADRNARRIQNGLPPITSYADV